jgi:hypothetical protein
MRFMYNCFYFLIIGFFFVGCEKKENSKLPAPIVQWNKIVIKDEFQVSAIYGDIDREMIIGTNQNILKTADSGRTWINVAQNVNTIREFRVSGDTLLGISGWPNYYSLNNGTSWQVLGKEMTPDSSKWIVTIGNLSYKIIHHADGENALPNDVLQSSDNGETWQSVFPYQHYITKMYADNFGKLYLGIWGATWNGTGFISNNPDDAIMYYVRGK